MKGAGAAPVKLLVEKSRVFLACTDYPNYEKTIRQLIENHPYSAVQVLQRLREDGYDGGITIVKDYLATVRPRRAPAFLTLAFAPGECAQGSTGATTARSTSAIPGAGCRSSSWCCATRA